jgi:hypothetical protein
VSARDIRGRALIFGSVIAAAALVIVFLALGGSSYAPAKTRDPCKARSWPQDLDLQGTIEQFSLSALDGTACELHVSRETLVLALASSAGRERFAEDPRFEQAVRDGLERAIDDGERAGAINSVAADGLRQLARHAPVDEVVALLRDAGPLFGGLGGLLQGLGGLVPDQLQGLAP